MADLCDAILAERLVATVRLQRYGRAVEVAQALAAGGVRVIEFTLTGAGALAAIAAVRAALGVVGAGTVLSAAEAEAALDAGAACDWGELTERARACRRAVEGGNP